MTEEVRSQPSGDPSGGPTSTPPTYQPNFHKPSYHEPGGQAPVTPPGPSAGGPVEPATQPAGSADGAGAPVQPASPWAAPTPATTGAAPSGPPPLLPSSPYPPSGIGPVGPPPAYPAGGPAPGWPPGGPAPGWPAGGHPTGGGPPFAASGHHAPAPPPRETWRRPSRVEAVPGTGFAVVHLDVPPVTSGLAVGALVAGIGSILVSLLVSCFGLIGSQDGWGGWVAGAFAVLGGLLGLAGVVLGLIARRQILRVAEPPAIRFTGRGLAISAVSCGGTGLGITVLSLGLALLLQAA